jgi:hypothetical protein
MSEQLIRKDPPDVVGVENPPVFFKTKILTQLFEYIMKRTIKPSLEFPILLMQLYQLQIWL